MVEPADALAFSESVTTTMPARRKQTSSKEPVTEAELPIGMAFTAQAERAANCELDLIRLFLSQQKHDIA